MSQRVGKTSPMSLIQGCASKPCHSWDTSTIMSQCLTCFDGTVKITVSEVLLMPRRISQVFGFHISCTYLPPASLKPLHSRLWNETQKAEVHL